ATGGAAAEGVGRSEPGSTGRARCAHGCQQRRRCTCRTLPQHAGRCPRRHARPCKPVRPLNRSARGRPVARGGRAARRPPDQSPAGLDKGKHRTPACREREGRGHCATHATRGLPELRGARPRRTAASEPTRGTLMDETPVREFTTAVPRWSPHVAPIRLENATEAQQEALKVTPSNTKVSDYMLVLAHDPESLKQRNPLFNEIMYGPGGLSRADRELGSAAASVVNHCVYCTAVHSSRYIELTDQRDIIERIFEDELRAVLPAREQVLFDYAARLAVTPPAVDAESVQALRDAGLSDLEIVDLTLASGIFAWANR